MTDSSGDVETIKRLENERFESVVAGNFDRLAELCHPELSYTHINGATDTYESYLRKCRDGVRVFHRMDHPVHRATVVEDTAVVLGEMNADLTSGGAAKRLSNLTLAVWVRQDEGWKLLAFHPMPRA